MEDNPRRRFTLVDAMILIAAIAVGFAWIRLSFLSYFGGAWIMKGDRRREVIRKYIMSYMTGMMPLFISSMAGVVVLGFKRPRPPIRDLFQHPGFAACFTSLILFVSGSLRYLASDYLASDRLDILIWTGSKRFLPGSVQFQLPLVERFRIHCLQLIMPIAFVILAQWISLALSGLWMPQPTWLDRLGIFLGVAWLLYLLIPGML